MADTVEGEFSTYLHELDWVLSQQLVCAGGLSSRELSWRPPFQGANHVSAIVGHALAVTRAFVLGVVGGQPLERDRPAEFETEYAGYIELERAVEELRGELKVLGAFTIDLESMVLPSTAAWGSAVDVPMPRRQVMAEALRHAAIHLGELRFTLSLIDAERARGA